MVFSNLCDSVKKCGGVAVQTTHQLHTLVHASSNFVANSSLVRAQDSANRSISTLPQYSVWWTAAVNLLSFCHWSSFATTRNVFKNEHCLAVLSPWALDVCLSSQSIHCYSHAPAPERSCCLVRVTALRKVSHMRWEMPFLLSATLSEQRYICFILHFNLMSCNNSAWLFFCFFVFFLATLDNFVTFFSI